MKNETRVSDAYLDALEHLSETKGPHMALVVQSIIEGKNNLTVCELLLNAPTPENKGKLLALLAEQIASNVATMCTILGKEFKADILPLVQQVTEEARRSPKLQ